jgi:hypothetical protein
MVANNYIGGNYRDIKIDSESNVVVDLSRHINKLQNYEDISSDLNDEEENKIVQYVKAMVDMSHDKIKNRYDHWREADMAHDVYVKPSSTKFREKAVIADTRAVADTVTTYLMSALAGRNPMFMLEGLNRKSRKVAAVLERVLHQHMRRTAGEARMAQMLLDSVRYGFAPTKIVWDSKFNQSKIVNFDPRRVFPDPRVQWGDWENMQYIVCSDFQSYNALVQSGLYPKLKKYPGLRSISPMKNSWNAHRFQQEKGRGLSIDPAESLQKSNTTQGSFFTLGDARMVDEAWIKLSGAEINIPSIETIYLVVAILDEQVCVRFQLNPYGQQLPFAFGGLFQDSHKTYGQSLYDILLPLHDIATWLLRSRIDNVQAALNNLIFVDPTQVSVPDLVDRNPYGIVRTLPGTKPGDGVFIAQVPDVTKGHWNDIGQLGELKQRLSAASDAQQGMPTGEVRTATEIARLTQLGSQRLGGLARIMSATTVRPMVRMMIANIQDALAYDGSIKMDPYNMPTQLADMVDDGYIDFSVQDLQGDIDYLVIDGSLPIEPTRNAETWMNMLKVMGETGLNMEYNTAKIAEEAIRAMGISDLDQFRISKEQQAQGPTPSQQMSLMEKMRGASVQPNEDVQREVEAGNLIPLTKQMGGR